MFRILRKRRPTNAVRQDWHAELSAEKLELYTNVLPQIESAHAMYSVALNEAISFHKWRRHEMALDQVAVSAELCERFSTALDRFLQTLEDHAQHFGTLPSVESLDPTYFLGSTARRAASMNSALSSVLFNQRKRFLHKLKTLGEITSNAAMEFRATVTDIMEGSASSSAEYWELLGTLQFDLTTSMAEATVVFKSFLVAMPKNQVATLRDRLKASLSAPPAIVTNRVAAARRV